MGSASLDTIGYWSEIKLAIVREYAQAYSRILTSNRLYHVYIDAFAGAGVHISRKSGEFVPGSPLNALWIQPPFREYYLIDMDSGKAEQLRQLASAHSKAHILEGDCNDVLLARVFPNVQYAQYRRGLCLLDPYGLHLDWRVISTAARMESIEVFLNFPLADMNRNVLWHDPKSVDPAQAGRMRTFWGDDTWKQAAYDTRGNLFGWEEKQPNQAVALAFAERLKKVAGFKHVPEPMPMRNTKGAIVYYLFFASPKAVAAGIVEDIFQKYRDRGRI